MTKTTPSLNGVVKITRRSLKQFQFGDDPPITLDVIAIVDQWHEINFSLRILENGMWVLPPSKTNEHAQNRLNFVQAIINEAYAPGVAPTLDRGEAEEFIATVQREAETLRNFIYPRDEGTLSAPESTDRGTTFSQ